jgi:hypothetical protein
MSSSFSYKICLLVIYSSFFIGAYVLEGNGIQYVSEGGSFVFKIHLYSYVILISFLYLLFRVGPIQILSNFGCLTFYWLLSLCAIVFVIFFGLYKQGTSGMAYLVDTILVPILFAAVIMRLSANDRHKIVNLLAWLILLNSIVAIIEFSTNSRFISYVPDSFNSFFSFRSTAFLSHPLNNSLITASLAPMLMNKTKLPAFLYFCIVLLALFALGGRGAMGIFLLVSVCISFNTLKNFFCNGIRMGKAQFSIILVLTYVATVVIMIMLVYSGIADRIVGKLHVDDSAQVRLDVYLLLEQLSAVEWLFGAGYSLRDSVEFYIGVKTIENYLIGWVFSFGLIGALSLFISSFGIFYKIILTQGGAVRFSIIGFLLISITNNALAAKTPALLFLIITVLCLFQDKNKWSVH